MTNTQQVTWTTLNDEYLKRLYISGFSLQEISYIMKRPTDAVLVRLIALDTLFSDETVQGYVDRGSGNVYAMWTERDNYSCYYEYKEESNNEC